MGMKKSNSTRKGDLIVRVNIQIPKNLTSEELKLFKKLSELRSK